MAQVRSRKRRGWRRDTAGHRTAGRIGRAYRKGRKGPRDPLRYLAAAGVSMGALKKYRSSHPMTSKLRSRRKHKVRTVSGVAINSGRGGYRAFVKAGMKRIRPRGAGAARAAMRTIARAWRSGRGAAANITMPGAVDFNRGRRRNGRKARASRNRSRARRNGPILPYMAFENRGQKRRKSRARRNPVLPYAAFNVGGMDPVGSVISALKETVSVNFWTGTVLPLSAGFIGGQFAGGAVLAMSEKVFGKQLGVLGSVQRIGSRMIGAAGVSALSLLVLRAVKLSKKPRDFALKVLAGGLVSVFASIIQEFFGADTYAKITGMSGFGDMADGLTEELKNRIAQSVRSEIAAAEGSAPVGASAFVTTQDMATSPLLGPGPAMGGTGAFVNTQDLRTAPTFNPYGGPADAPMVADLSAFSDNTADMMLV